MYKILCVTLCLSSNVFAAGTDSRPVFAHVLEAGLDIYAPVSPELGDVLCRKHGIIFRRGVEKGQLWALNMLDASSKLPSGLLTGNLVQLGNFDQCLAVHHEDPVHGLIRGQHCLVSLGIENIFSALSIQKKTAAGGINGTGMHVVESLIGQARFADALRHMGATWSLCIPSSCTPRELELHLRSVIGDLIDVRVDDLGCNSRQEVDTELTLGLLLAVVVFGCIGVFVLLGTSYDLWTEAATSAEPRNQQLLAFSLYTNGKALLKTSVVATNLSTVNGIRCLSTFWVILIHHFVFSLAKPAINMLTLNDMSKDWTHLLAANGSLSVDSFLLMSGLLVCYNYLKDREANVEFGFWRYYVNRYVRLTPVYAVMMLLTATLLNAAGDAPLVKANAHPTQNSCAERGWLGLVYLANYLDTERSCVGVAWHLSVDMQLFWISPLLLYPLWRKARFGLALLFTVIGAGCLAVFFISYSHRLPILNLLHHSTTSMDGLVLYYCTHTRTSPWLIGIVLGYLLHKTRTTQLTTSTAIVGWTLSVVAMGYAFFSAHSFLQDDAVYDRVATAFYLASMRPAWALGLGWVIFACERGAGGFVNTFLSWPGWQVPSRLCYSVFFTHWVLVTGFPVIKKTSQHFNDLALMTEYLGIVVLSFALAVLLHLTVEVPSILLYRLHSKRRLGAAKKSR